MLKTLICNEDKKLTIKINKICAVELENGEYFHKIIIFLDNGKDLTLHYSTKTEAEKIYIERDC